MKQHIISTAILALIFLLVIFSISPIIYYKYKWDFYWETRDSTPVIVDSNDEFKFESKATSDCISRARSYFKLPAYPELAAYASSTSSNYETYDCYALKFTKLPTNPE